MKTTNLVGVGLRGKHIDQFIHEPPNSVSWVEVISENYMNWKSLPYNSNRDRLLKVRNLFPIALHGVSMNLGSVDPLDLEYMARLKHLVEIVDPLWVSDHLCWTGVHGVNLHDLYPLPYTEEALKNFCSKLNQAQDFLNRKLVIENVSSYVSYQSSEMTESEFINQVLKRTGCNLLLDINNVYVSSKNHNFDAHEFISEIPLDRIQQIHLAGHAEKDGFLIDTHAEAVTEEVWELYTWFCQRYGLKPTMIERDANIPNWEEFENELLRIRRIQTQARKQYEFERAPAIL